MWIRTQDRERLINVNEVYIDTLVESSLTIHSGDDAWLGTYSTKERCLEVLDEIEECIDLGYVPVRIPNRKTQEKQVFQMPKE